MHPHVNHDLEHLAPRGVLETALYVDDLDRAVSFYTTVLGLRQHPERSERHVFFYCGSGMLLLFHRGATLIAAPGPDGGGGFIPAHGTTGQGHIAFRVTADEIQPWRDRLTASAIPVESEIHWPSGGRSLYFRDPDGNSLELATPQLWGLV